jgi:Lrp/AsnC family transcriptional regulator of ectoine degradation
LHDYPEIQACWAIGGGLDYFMQVVTKSIDSYQRLIDELLDRKIGLARYFTYIVTKPIKKSAALPLDHLLGGEKSTFSA